MQTIFSKFPKTFWVANTIELFERFAWYGFFMLFANYLTKSSELGGLEFSQSQKGWIMGVGTAIVYFLPVITGAIADKWGYKRVLILAFIVYASAFLLMPQFTSFAGVFFIYTYLAIGAALFKPVISATIAKTTTEKTASIGFGIFYMMVNVGSFFGPLLTLAFKDTSYDLVFYISAAIISVNFILILFYKEPAKEQNTDDLWQTILQIFKNIFTVLADFKFVLFLIIAAGFWTMYLQLFFSLPVFIEQWVDTSSWFDYFTIHFPFVAETYSIGDQMDPEFITNFDAMFIILFQVLISSIIMRWKALNVMVSGFLISTIGMSLTVLTQNPLYIVAALFVFAIGEMTASPKITEYIGRIAPADKKALYMGYSFIPMFLGNLFTGIISGEVYQMMSDKVEIVREEAAKLDLSFPESLTQTEEFNLLAEKMGYSSLELTNYLWTNYEPYNFWMVIAAIGGGAALSLLLYNTYLMRE